MNIKNDWENKAEHALSSLNGIQRAASNPYLYTRVRARLALQQNKWSKAAEFISRPVIVFSVVALFTGFNAWALVHQPAEKVAAKRAQEFQQAFDQDFATVNYSLGK